MSNKLVSDECYASVEHLFSKFLQVILCGVREQGRRRKEEFQQWRFSEPLNLLFCSSFSCSPISLRFTFIPINQIQMVLVTNFACLKVRGNIR